MSQASKLKDFAVDVIDNIAEELHEISKGIWENPELAYEEHKAHDLLTSYLEKKGLEVQKKYVCETGFRLTYSQAANGDENGPHVAILCEYDALPGIGHACGHNLIAEVGIGAGIAVLETLKQRDLPGKVTLLGCPAEEGGCGGKVKMIEADVFKDIDVAMMAHPATVNATNLWGCEHANLRLYVTYKGKASHAAAFPWEGKNALDAAVLAYNNISCYRQQMKPEWRVSGVITNGGEKANIIPEETSMEYCVRAPTLKELEHVTEEVKGCFEAAATATGCKMEIVDNRTDKCATTAYYNLVSNKELESLYAENASKIGLTMDTKNETSAAMVSVGSTDMGNVSHVVPSLHPLYALNGGALNHTREFTEKAGAGDAQPPTLTQAKLLAMTAIDVYCNREMLAKIKENFMQDPNRGSVSDLTTSV